MASPLISRLFSLRASGRDALVHEGCVGETLAAALAREERERTTDSVVRGVLDRIVADEERHALRAWRALGWLVEESRGAAEAARTLAAEMRGLAGELRAPGSAPLAFIEDADTADGVSPMALPGMPGILVGRTKHVAFGVTNAYGDVQDVYIETLDPNDKSRYLHGGKSTAFTVVEETIRIKDQAAPGGLREQPLRIRYTVHGPVISDHPGLGSGGDKILALRSTDAEVLAPVLGIEGLLTAPDAAAFDREVQKIDLMMFNFVFGDDKGSIGHRASGAVPVAGNRCIGTGRGSGMCRGASPSSRSSSARKRRRCSGPPRRSCCACTRSTTDRTRQARPVPIPARADAVAGTPSRVSGRGEETQARRRCASAFRDRSRWPSAQCRRAPQRRHRIAGCRGARRAAPRRPDAEIPQGARTQPFERDFAHRLFPDHRLKVSCP